MTTFRTAIGEWCGIFYYLGVFFGIPALVLALLYALVRIITHGFADALAFAGYSVLFAFGYLVCSVLLYLIGRWILPKSS